MKDNLQRGVPVFVEITGKIQFPSALLKIGYILMGSDGAVLYESDVTDSAQEQWPNLEAGFVRLRSPLPIDWLNEGSHHVELTASIQGHKWICRPGNTSPSITFNVTGPLSEISVLARAPRRRGRPAIALDAGPRIGRHLSRARGAESAGMSNLDLVIQMMGGLGNQLFQYALGRRLQIERNANVCFDLALFDQHNERALNIRKYRTHLPEVSAMDRAAIRLSFGRTLSRAGGGSEADCPPFPVRKIF